MLVCSVINKLPDAIPDHVRRQVEMAYQLVPTVSRYQYQVASLGLPLPLLPYCLLVAPANAWVSLLLQLMKDTVLAEISFILSPGSLR